MDCVFCKIISGEIPSEKLYEDENIVAFNDISPVTPIHILVAPKKHINSLAEVEAEDLHLISEAYSVIKHLAEEFSLASGYRVIINVGYDGGQTVNHLHFHLIGGRKLTEKLC